MSANAVLLVVCMVLAGAVMARAHPPNSGEKIFFGQTSCNIRQLIYNFLNKEEQSPFHSILFFIYVKYSFEF